MTRWNRHGTYAVTSNIQAVYRDGVFLPPSPVPGAERTRAELTVDFGVYVPVIRKETANAARYRSLRNGRERNTGKDRSRYADYLIGQFPTIGQGIEVFFEMERWLRLRLGITSESPVTAILMLF